MCTRITSGKRKLSAGESVVKSHVELQFSPFSSLEAHCYVTFGFCEGVGQLLNTCLIDSI